MALGFHLLPKTDSSTFLLIYEQLISYLRESLFLLLKQMIHGFTNSFPPLLFGILSTRDNVSLFSHPIPCLCLHILTLGWGQSREKKKSHTRLKQVQKCTVFLGGLGFLAHFL